MTDVCFSINQYDGDGDRIAESINLVFNDFVTIHLTGMSDLDNVMDSLAKIKKEIEDNYDDFPQ